MHATGLQENLWGVRTSYGPHPPQPTRTRIRLRRGVRRAAVAVLAVWYFAKSR